MAKQGRYYVPAASSARHVHLCQKDIEVLFGSGYQLSEFKALSQPGQFASNEKISLKGSRGQIDGIRVLGPARPDTQVEISLTDSFKLGVKPMVRMSGNVDGAPGATLIGPKGQVELVQGVLISARHLHINEQQAAEFNMKDGDVVCLKKGGERETIFGNVVVRCGSGHSLEVHLDTDEANAALLKNGDLLEVIR
ncbi:MAG: phosphate propanoyltransferase [Clostridia bacterium]|nr:phosphate propanoyltransferase [Clostridia bacterium]MBT7122738.1 phosphate propanoyltransferase [Clostridia bacterium]